MSSLLSDYYKLLGMSKEDRDRAIYEDAWARELKKGMQARDSFIAKNKGMDGSFEWTPEMEGRFSGERQAAEADDRRRRDEAWKQTLKSEARRLNRGR